MSGTRFQGTPGLIKSYRDLRVWQKAMDVVVESYRVGYLLPENETYGLASQIQRAALSIPANVAEGHGREYLGDYLHHLSVANGSLMELETHLHIEMRLSYLNTNEVERIWALTAEVGRLLSVLTKKLKEKNT